MFFGLEPSIIHGWYLRVRCHAYSTQSFFGFGQSAEIEIVLNDSDKKKVEAKKEDGSKERLSLYYDGETVSGQVLYSWVGLV